MKIYNYTRKALALMATCLLLLSTDRTSQAQSADAGPQPASDDARLIVTRIPNLGNYVAVDLSVDGVAMLPITYGQSYEDLLSPGRHVMSVVASPDPRWSTRSTVVLNVQKGQTYRFTAMGDGSGHLILKGP
jgi:hypothetical protein